MTDLPAPSDPPDPDVATVRRFLDGAPRDLDLYNACCAYSWRFDGENNFDSYSNGELALMRFALPHCRVAVDVGANRGRWIETALTINPALALHAFEPSTATFALLAAVQFSPHVTLNRIALGERAEEGELFEFGGEPTSELRSLYKRAGAQDYRVTEPSGSERVAITTLDRYCAEHELASIDFLKIDTEGHDLRVLHGARDLVARRAIRFVQFEYGPPNIDSRTWLKDFFDFFSGHGYALHKLHPSGYSHYPAYLARLENFRYQNWVALRGD
jgi:FkbM family methyltransferase